MKSNRSSKATSRRSFPFLMVHPDGQVSLQEQIYRQLREAILQGRFNPGARVPSSRALAEELGISRNTALYAYDRLHAEGYFVSQPGAGTFVSPEMPEDLLRSQPGAPHRIAIRCAPSERVQRMVSYPTTYGTRRVAHLPFRPSLPAYEEFPLKLFGTLMSAAWVQATAAQLGYGDPAGYLPLREAIAAYLAEFRGVRCTAQQIIITLGSQQAILLSAQVLLEPGAQVLMEDPGYLSARSALLTAGAELCPNPLDAEGAVVPHGRTTARLAYLTPSFQYPLGMVMSLPRRLAWLEWARMHDGWLLEDDYDSEFRYTGRPLPALQGLQPDARVIYIGTFSKVLVPGLRMGYLVAPEGLVDAFVAARRMNGLHSPQIDQVAISRFIEQGHFNRHLRRMRVLYADRQEVLVRAIKSELCDYLDADLQPAGMQLPARILSRHAAERLVERAERAGLVLVPLGRFALRAAVEEGFLLGYTSFTARTLKEGCVRLRQVFRG